MIDGWEWDSTLFRGSAAYYERGRLPYAPGLAETLAAECGFDGRGRLLDVGCGPGIVIRQLAPYFEEAIGLDPDRDMLAEAARHGAAGTRWVTGRAEDLPAGLGEFRVVVFAQSFHWTDRERVAATVLRMLEPGGLVVNVCDQKDPPPAPAPLPRPAPPYGQIGELVRRYLGPARRAGQGVLVNGTPNREDLVMERAGFEDFRQFAVPAGQVVDRPEDDVVAWTFSRSDSAPHLFGDRLAEFEADLRALLRDVSPGGFAEHLPPTQIMTWRRP